MAAVVPSSASRPRFRTDLVAEPIEEEGQRFVDVIDPDTGSSFRFYDVEYSLACAMDGERDIQGLVAWAREELGVAPTSEELSTVIATLGDLGYIDASDADTQRRADTSVDEELDLEAAGSLRPGVTSRRAETPRGEIEDVELGFADARNRPPTAAPPVLADLGEVEDVELGHTPPPTPGAAPPAPSFATSQQLGPAGAQAAARDAGMSRDERFAGVRNAAGSVVEFDALTPPPPEEMMATRPVLRPITRADADDDGPTNLPRPDSGDFDDDEVSVDLTDHMSLRPDDVKEAVRASQVMRAVEVPPELMGQLDDRERALAASAEAAKNAARHRAMSESPTRPVERVDIAEPVPVVDAAPAAGPAVAPSAPRIPAASASASSMPTPAASAPAAPAKDRAAIELPRDPVAVSKPKTTLPIPARPSEPLIARPVAPVEPTPSRAWPLLLVLLILAIVAVAAFFVWRLLIDKPAVTDVQPPPAETVPAPDPGAAVAPKVVEPPPPPPAPTAVLALSSSGAVEAKSQAIGIVSFAVGKGTEVKVDDILVKLGGYQKYEAKLGDAKTGGLLWDIEKRLPRELEGYQEQITAARAAGRELQAKQIERKLAERTARLDQKKRDRDEAQALLDKLIVRASTAGTVTTIAAPGKRVRDGDVVVTIAGQKALTATFEAGDKAYTADAPVKVAVKATPDKKLDCTIAEVKGSAVTVSCPADAGVADGTEIVVE